jgi:predicted CopG family antitoxin
MASKSIELSDETYKELSSLKPTHETWDEFLIRLSHSVKITHPTDEELDIVSKKNFKNNKEVFQKLAE